MVLDDATDSGLVSHRRLTRSLSEGEAVEVTFELFD